MLVHPVKMPNYGHILRKELTGQTFKINNMKKEIIYANNVNKDLFKSVVTSNIGQVINSISNDAMVHAALHLNTSTSEEEIRREAVKFFTLKLSERLTEYLR